MNRETRAREIQQSIAQVLRERWDPISIADDPDVADEYDSYVGGIYRLLASNAGPTRVAEHLAAIEREEMGFDQVSASALIPVAEHLCRLDIRLDSAS